MIYTTQHKNRWKLQGYNSTQDAGISTLQDPLVTLWLANVTAASGTLTANSLNYANSLAAAFRASTFFSKIIYFMPLLGSNLAAARVPLIDTLSVGIASNTSFVDADFDETVGLQGNGSSKYLDSLVRPGDVGGGTNGGLGWWEANITSPTNVEPCGCYSSGNTHRWCVDLRPTLQAFRWGTAGTGPSLASAAVNGHYYGQQVGISDRKLYRDGSQIASNTSTGDETGISDRTMLLMGVRDDGGPNPWGGCCAAAYFTDGTLSPTEISNLHTLLDTYLITPTGR